MPRGCFATSGSKCVPGKKSRCFHYIEIQAKILLSPGFQIEISRLWCRTPKSYCTDACLTCLSSLSSPNPHPSLSKNTQYYGPSRSAGEEMMASTNINDNQWLCEAKRHKHSSSPSTSSSTVPRICNYRMSKKKCL